MECLAAAFAAARLGSFSAAAAELGVNHATISRRVAGAERWAAMKLFDRHARGVRTTALGQMLLLRLAASLDGVNAVIDRERAPRRRPVVRIGVTPSFARFWLWRRIPSLERDDLTIDVVAELRAADLEHGEVDLAIRYGRGGWRFDHVEPLFEEHLVPFASRAKFPTFADAEPEEIVALPLLHNGPTRGWPTWSAHHDLRVRRKAIDRSVSDTGQVVDAARAGLGVGLWITALRLSPAASRELVFRRDLMIPAELRYYVVMNKPRADGPVALLVERIRAQAGRSAE
jgi:DNA-binding transcriptional LysR family regulator